MQPEAVMYLKLSPNQPCNEKPNHLARALFPQKSAPTTYFHEEDIETVAYVFKLGCSMKYLSEQYKHTMNACDASIYLSSSSPSSGSRNWNCFDSYNVPPYVTTRSRTCSRLANILLTSGCLPHWHQTIPVMMALPWQFVPIDRGQKVKFEQQKASMCWYFSNASLTFVLSILVNTWALQPVPIYPKEFTIEVQSDVGC